MSALPLQAFGSPSPAPSPTRWLMRRNCSLAPSQLVLVFASLAVLALAIAAAFWAHGATLVLPFAGVELLALGVGIVAYARHAADREQMVLEAGRLKVECTLGNRVERADFAAQRVHVDAAQRLIELSGDGQRIAVGRFVRPEARDRLACELRTALSRPEGSVPSERTSDDGAPSEPKRRPEAFSPLPG